MENISFEQLTQIGLTELLASFSMQPEKRKADFLLTSGLVPHEQFIGGTTTTPRILIKEVRPIRSRHLEKYLWRLPAPLNVTQIYIFEGWHCRDKNLHHGLSFSIEFGGPDLLDTINQKRVRSMGCTHIWTNREQLQSSVMPSTYPPSLLFQPARWKNSRTFSSSKKPSHSKRFSQFNHPSETNISFYLTIPSTLPLAAIQSIPSENAMFSVSLGWKCVPQRLVLTVRSRAKIAYISDRSVELATRLPMSLNGPKTPRTSSDDKMWKCSTVRCGTAPSLTPNIAH